VITVRLAFAQKIKVTMFKETCQRNYGVY